VTIGAVVREHEVKSGEVAEGELLARMAINLQVMRKAVARGLSGIKSRSGLTGGDARRVDEARRDGRLIVGDPLDSAIVKALAVSEVNAAMGRIVAAPTAGSCGVLPGVLLSVAEKTGADDAALVDALFAAGGVGQVIAGSASLAGAEGGCQAECGSAAAMAAAGATQMSGGTPAQCMHAAAIALKGLMGLVCDPVAGLVEVPCVKRNALAAAIALAAMEMALAGVESVIPADEVVGAMGAVGRALPASLRETSQGGLAVTPTGCRLAHQFTKPNSS
jgi:L-serine dehydratase